MRPSVLLRAPLHRQVARLALALLALGSSVGGSIHLALVPHLTIVEAGRFVEAERGDVVPSCLPSRPTFAASAGSLVATPLEACPVCALYDTSRRDAALLDAPAAAVTAQDARPSPERLHDPVYPDRAAILHVAPKTSPPA
jgi:hypothetical protein